MRRNVKPRERLGVQVLGRLNRTGKKTIVIITGLLTAAVLMVVLVISNQSKDNESVDSVPKVAETTAEADDFDPADIVRLSEAVKAGFDDGTFVSSIAASPLYDIDEQGNVHNKVISNLDQSSRDQQSYQQLHVFCLGKGDVVISFTVGTESKEDRLNCSPELASTSITLKAQSEGPSRVFIAPADDKARLQVAYRVDAY